MAWLYPISSSTVGINQTLASDEDIVVGGGVAIASASSAGIYGTNGYHKIVVAGTVMGNFGVFLSSTAPAANDWIEVMAGGQILSGGLATIYARSSGINVINKGLIWSGEGVAVGIDGIGGGASTIRNEGMISSYDTGISRWSAVSESISFVNSGTLTAVIAYKGNAVVATDVIVNTGRITGTVLLGGGNDTYDGTAGWISGAIHGEAGADLIKGGSQANSIFGGSENDTLFGFGGNDVIDGGTGADWIYGGLGADQLTGGLGADTFRFTSLADSTVASAGRDIIRDFNRGQADRIDLSMIDANTLTTGNGVFTFIGRGAFTGVAGQLHYEQISGQTYVSGDVNGDRVADLKIQVSGLVSLVAGDFVL